MLAASAEYQEYEALTIGATPAVRASFLPYIWPNGVNADGDFVECLFIAPNRIQAHYHGFASGSWISEVLTANLQVTSSPAVLSWEWNYPGFDVTLYYRGADDTTALAAASWTQVSSGDTIQIYAYYQFKLTIEGYRAWAENALSDAGNFSAYAVASRGDPYDSYASEAHVAGDPRTYIHTLQPLGEFTVVRDIVEAGSLSMEAPTDFSDLVAGEHSGMLLNNCQGVWIGGVWTPAPLFSPNKSSFFLSQQDWYNIMLKIELGWAKGGWFASEFGADEWLSESYSDFITLFLGRVKKWGPVGRAVGAPHNVEVYAADFIMDCLQKRICLPAADGSPAPLTYGEFLCKGEAISGWSPAPVVKSAYFEAANFNELDHIVAEGGGAFSLITPGLIGDRAFRAAVTGANQSAYGSLSLASPGEMFVTGTMRFTVAPASLANSNFTVLNIVDAAGITVFGFTVTSDGVLYSDRYSELSDFNILAYLDVPLPFAMWISPVLYGHIRLWINGDEVFSVDGSFTVVAPLEFRFGAVTGGTAESWTVDFDDIEVRQKYYHNAFQVFGGPFESIGPVYIDNLAQPNSKTVGAYTQTLTRYPEYGMVQFESTDPDFDPSGDVMFRVVETAGGQHALAIIEDLLDRAGLTDYVDATALAAAYLAVPDDIIHARFEGGAVESRGLKDYASLGVTVAEALKEICSRCLYWIFVDAGKIKIVPYTAAPLVTPTDPRQIFTASNKWENNQVIDLENINAFVTVVYGWYERNPALHYVAGTQEAGGQGAGLDFSWAGPVACENRAVAVAKADLLLKFLSAQERIDPVTTTLAGARLELMTDVVNLADEILSDAAINYLITGKEVGLDQGGRITTLQLIRFLGE